MKRLLLASCLLIIFIASKAQNPIDVLHYKFSIELNDNNDTIYGVAEIKLKMLAASASIKFDIRTSNAAGKGMKIDKVTGTSFRDFTKKNDSIVITLAKQLSKDDTATYTVTYHGVPSDGLIISKNKYGHRTFFSDNWPNRAHNWIPCHDDPSDKASVEFIITAPSHYQVISNGVQTEETNLSATTKLTRWKEDVPLPTKVMVIGVADFAVSTVGDVNCVPVSTWVFPENRADGFNDYAVAKNILTYFMNYIGPYGYKKLANVQSKTIFGGMENASAIFYFENSVTGANDEESLMAHEIAHQWFGNMATEKSFAHLWLSEGFATYLTHIYLESKYGTDSLNKRMQADRGDIIDFVNGNHRSVVDETADYMKLLNANSYQKGGWILHMLRRQLGDSVFKKAIRQYYASYAGKNADTKDLQRVFETVSGKDLEQFFQQWLYKTVDPSLKISWHYNDKEKKIALDIMQLQDGTPFVFPLDVEITSASGKKTIQHISISSKAITLSLPVTERPVELRADPNTSLLFEWTVEAK